MWLLFSIFLAGKLTIYNLFIMPAYRAIQKTSYVNSLRCDSLMQIKCTTESSYGSFLLYLWSALCCHLSSGPTRLWSEVAISRFYCRNIVPSKSSGTKWKYFLTVSEEMLILTFPTNMDIDQVPPNVGPDLRSILFEPQPHFLLKTSCISWYELNFEN